MARLAVSLVCLAVLRVTSGGGSCRPPEPTGTRTVWELESNQCGSRTFQIFVQEPDGQAIFLNSGTSQPNTTGFQWTFSGITLTIECVQATIASDSVREYTLTFTFKDSDGCVSEDVVQRVIFTDLTENPLDLTISPAAINIVKDLFEKEGRSEIVTFNVTGSNTISHLSVDQTNPAGVPLYISNFTLILNGSLQGFDAAINVTVNAIEGETVRSSSIVTVNLKERPYFIQPTAGEDIYFCEDFIGGDVIYDNITYMNPNEGGITIEIIGSSLFHVNATERTLSVGMSVVAGDFDVDVPGAVTEYTLTLRISDGSYDNEISVTLHVDDVNDNAPDISAVSPVSVLETLAGGSVIYNFTVTDIDKDAPNNEVSLSLSGENSDHFTIDGHSLRLASPSQIDYSTFSVYNLTLNATDKAEDDEELWTATYIVINVDTAPVFNASGYQTSIKEDIQRSASVFTLNASDEDGSSLTYSIMYGTGLFMVDGADVKVAADANLSLFDVDTGEKSFRLQVSVTDEKYTSTVTLMVDVTDVNDLAPVFDKDSYPVFVHEDTPSGTNILNVSATDSDLTSPNNEVTYSLSGIDSEHFEIGADSGAVQIKDPSSLNYANRGVYNLIATATDKGDPAMSASVEVLVTIETTPVLIKPAAGEAPTEIAENIQAGQVVYTFSATDQDNTDDEMMYSIIHWPVGSADLFEVVGNTLKTKPDLTADALDVDGTSSVRQYNLTVGVSDGKYHTEGYLVIDITDVNDNSPYFDTPSTTYTINETAAGVIATVEAMDSDYTSPNNEISYSIVDGNDENLFEMGTVSGTISLVKEIKEPSYSLTVRAMDGGTTPLFNDTQVLFIVNKDVIDECASDPCKNGATCRSNVNYYFCDCADGWTGVNCEINKNDCEPDPCQNGGECQDGVAEFTCNCAAGWEGSNCTEACTGHTFGRNCAENCVCNVSNVAETAASQHCDIETGACYCNNHWTGNGCNVDVEECTQGTELCTEGNTTCVDTLGSYECICRTGYIADNNGCILDNTTDNPTILPDTTVQQAVDRGSQLIYIKITLNVPTCPRLDVPSVYSQIKQNLEEQMKSKLGLTVTVYNISCGSINYNSLCEVTKEDDLASVSTRLREVKESGTVVVENMNVSVAAMEINENPVPEKPSLCVVYESIASCGTGYKCTVLSDGRPTCQEKKDDNTALILGLGLGIGGSFVLILMVILLAVCCSRSRDSRSLLKGRYSGKHYAQDGPDRGSHSMATYNRNSKLYDNRPPQNGPDSYLFYKG